MNVFTLIVEVMYDSYLASLPATAAYVRRFVPSASVVIYRTYRTAEDIRGPRSATDFNDWAPITNTDDSLVRDVDPPFVQN